MHQLSVDVTYPSDLVGTKIIPADFIATVESHNPIGNGLHHEVIHFIATEEDFHVP